MTFHKTLLTSLFLILFFSAKATTWDEPWHNAVVKQSSSFVLAKVIKYDLNKGITISILKILGGKPLADTVNISNFYLLKLCSSSGNEGPEFHFKNVDSCYFFIKQNDKKEYCIATPTTGYAPVKNAHVAATYRHSYHQALVDMEIYEKTMLAIFNNYHGLDYDKAYIANYIDKYLSMKPSGYNKDEADLFFKQHVALESIYHLNLTGYYDKIMPFLNDTTNFHARVSAARALSAYDNDKSTTALLNILNDNNSNDFIKVICIWTLRSYQPKAIKTQLSALEKNASTEENGFGGNIMDPRVCTNFPTVKEALAELITQSK